MAKALDEFLEVIGWIALGIMFIIFGYLILNAFLS